MLRRKSAHSSENLAAKKRTVRRKGVILLNRVAAEKCTLIEKSDGEKAHSPMESVILLNRVAVEK